MPKKSKVLTTLIVTGLLCSVLLVIFYSRPYSEAKSACLLFRDFSSQVRSGRWTNVDEMLVKSDAEESVGKAGLHLRVNDKRLFYGNTDITRLIVETKVRFWPTFDYYRTRSGTINKVIFEDGYAFLENGKITTANIP